MIKNIEPSLVQRLINELMKKSKKTMNQKENQHPMEMI